MNVKVKINHKNLAAIEDIAERSLAGTAEAIREDVQQAETMPFDTGTLQKDSTFVDISQIKKLKAMIVSDTPYARKVYFNPEGYVFQKTHNKRAGERWFEPYITGEKQDYAQREFERLMHSGMKRLGG